jgi:HD-GYP domain-containing protein (c-di-GMP phosphodiesterase class II)
VVENYRIPNGKGIISHVITTGKPIVVNDVKHDRRHFEGLDAITNFDTRSVLAVALRTHSINLGDSRGQSDERIIGGLEVLNKKNGHFDDMDLSLMEIFSNQAATILQTACLYDQADQLFLDVLQALMEAVDSKDPYTQGHSRRVSDFSVAIADELGVDGKTIHQIRIGSMLHDVGKIGIPDHILNKPGTLTRKEYLEISRHPMIGERIMKRVHLLNNELSAVIEHHERLDGSGYPLGLRGSEISMIGRIVAVADVFDALTSNRPYRAKLSVEESFQRLFDEADTRFDRKVVEALASAYKKGMIKI